MPRCDIQCSLLVFSVFSSRKAPIDALERSPTPSSLLVSTHAIYCHAPCTPQELIKGDGLQLCTLTPGFVQLALGWHGAASGRYRLNLGVQVRNRTVVCWLPEAMAVFLVGLHWQPVRCACGMLIPWVVQEPFSTRRLVASFHEAPQHNPYYLMFFSLLCPVPCADPTAAGRSAAGCSS